MNRKPYFAEEPNRTRFLREVERWIGTPFHPHGNLRSEGVDCVHLWAEVLVRTGHLDGYDFPHYVIDQGNHLDESPVEKWLASHPRFERLPAGEELIVGDLLSYRFGRVPFHLVGCIGMPLGVHVLAGGRVTEMRIDDSTFQRRFAGAFRPVSW